MYAEYRGGHTLLRAGNSIDNIGRGPAELHGRRIGPRFMRARQRILLRGEQAPDHGEEGRPAPVQARPPGLHWWKWYNAARFELWRVDGRGQPHAARARRAQGGLLPARPPAHAPGRAVVAHERGLPGLRHLPAPQRVTLGTSPGWSDIYPPSYPEQYIDVSGLRGCFAYVHIVDPNNVIYETNEDNNEAQVIVRAAVSLGHAAAGVQGARPRPAAVSVGGRTG